MEENKSITEKNIQEFETNDLIVEVYNKIANWHNSEPNKIALKFLTIDIIETIAGAAFNHLGLTYDTTLKMTDEERAKLEEKKRNSGEFSTSSIKDLSDEELIKEIERRKNSRI